MAGPNKRTRKPAKPESEEEHSSEESESTSYHGQLTLAIATYEDDEELSEEADVFGITSVINLTSHKETPCIQQFCSLLQDISSKHADPSIQSSIKNLLSESNKLGFLINERFVNIPAKISAVMLNSLYDEIERMKRKTHSEEIFSNDEEELFAKAADISFDFSVAKESDTGLSGRWLTEDKQVTPYRRILIFKAEKLKTIITEVTAFVQ
ncbi:hypothetical protein NQ317_015805 [Molorchus minor]|uniref:Protein BCCIP homolog n=1 Tax=Molorchus minor TaxID=1323400 RepID=A0ABQ9ISM5_9CUCU|nr:hypothetical protein NQ317_015805 [Molorchus minor]